MCVHVHTKFWSFNLKSGDDLIWINFSCQLIQYTIKLSRVLSHIFLFNPHNCLKYIWLLLINLFRKWKCWDTRFVWWCSRLKYQSLVLLLVLYNHVCIFLILGIMKIPYVKHYITNRSSWISSKISLFYIGLHYNC